MEALTNNMIPAWRSQSLQPVHCAQCGAEMTVSTMVRRASYCPGCRDVRRKRSQAIANERLRLNLESKALRQSSPGAALEVTPSMSSIEIVDAGTVAHLIGKTNSNPPASSADAPLRSQARGGGAPPKLMPKLPRRLMTGRCPCGVCPKCLEDARWERIFQEKFADPDYYSVQRVSRGSSLSSLEEAL